MEIFIDYKDKGNHVPVVIVAVLPPQDRHPAGDRAGCPTSPAAAAEGDLRNHTTPNRNQDPVLYYINRPGSETHRSPTNPGTSSLAVNTAS